MTVIVILLALISLLSLAGIAGYILLWSRKALAGLSLRENVLRNLSNASFILAMILFIGLVFYVPVVFPPDKNKPTAEIEGNIALSKEQVKYQKKYNMETFGVAKTSGTISYPVKPKDPKDQLIHLTKGEKGLKTSTPQPYDEIWVNSASNYKVYWNKGAFVAEIGYFDEKNPEWVMDRQSFLNLKEEPF